MKNSGQFKPNGAPWNAGLKGWQAGGRSVETQFKKGHLSGRARQLHKPVGYERMCKDGYLERKISDDAPGKRGWRGVHLIVWEEANGPLPTGCVVVFKDGNQLNTELSNLEMLTRAELMKRNSYHNYPKEVAQLIQLRGVLNRKINARAAHE